MLFDVGNTRNIRPYLRERMSLYSVNIEPLPLKHKIKRTLKNQKTSFVLLLYLLRFSIKKINSFKSNI